MMKMLSRLVLTSILILNASAGFSSAGVGGTGGGGSDSGGTGGQDLADLVKYFLNLGSFLGYNLQNDPTDSGKTKISYKLLTPETERDSDVPPVQLINNIVFNNFLGGSFLVNTVPTIAQVISDSAGGAYPDYVNPFASYSLNPQGLLKQASYSTQSQAGVSISALIDQPPYQTDPVAQSVLNILGTPDYSYCMDNAEKQFTCDYSETNNNSTKIINEYQVMANAIGTPLPGTNDYFTFSHIEPLLGQLNANSLITPLMYSNTAFQQNNNNNEGNKPGLKAMSQEQQAANFIRYVSGAVAPIVMPDRNVFDKWVTIAKQPTSVVQQQAQAIIATYLTALRVYAAQVSVGVSNLYYIMSKRLPQGEEGKAKSSQALSEFKMASWRLYNPGQTDMKSQWISQINNASAASVQKEMAVLLAEINYQLYLNRQQDERILLTNTLLLLQNSRAAQPNTQLNPPSTGVSGTQGSF
ncbi:MAG: type IV secretion protein IcmX [Tatlockia sp.]|nr:type IV secretion protein IcmX [Tatlockia sp.]